MSAQKTGILLANLGSPAEPTTAAVRQFLKEFLGDPRVVNIPRPLWLLILHGVILPFRPSKSLRAYKKIWHPEKGSPLTYLTKQLAEKLALHYQPKGVEVRYAMRYGQPSIASQLAQFKELGIEDIIVLPMYPQFSSTTTASIYDDFVKEIGKWWHMPSFRFIADYHQHPHYIEAVANSIQAAWQTQPKNQLLVMSFHGLPEQLTAWGDPYYHQCQRTGALLAEHLGLAAHEWKLVFQSRFGKAEWLKPYCVDVLEALPNEGVKTVDVVCPGFAVDCLETLEEIAMENKSIYLEAGGEEYRYIPALNDSEAHIDVLVSVISQMK
ncbi:MAG: ferrochelatase [Methylovulum sp.]|jgi:ferrochelatase|nr:ferrochelatase [Methylovulum sp.]MCF8000142.1 ferrochelatase [Methylovulum sp.]